MLISRSDNDVSAKCWRMPCLQDWDHPVRATLTGSQSQPAQQLSPHGLTAHEASKLEIQACMQSTEDACLWKSEDQAWIAQSCRRVGEYFWGDDLGKGRQPVGSHTGRSRRCSRTPRLRGRSLHSLHVPGEGLGPGELFLQHEESQHSYPCLGLWRLGVGSSAPEALTSCLPAACHSHSLARCRPLPSSPPSQAAEAPRPHILAALHPTLAL